MSDREELSMVTFGPNIPVKMRLERKLWEGEGKYGPSYLYKGTVNGKGVKFYAKPAMHAAIVDGNMCGKNVIICLTEGRNEDGKPMKRYVIKLDQAQSHNDGNEDVIPGIMDEQDAPWNQEEKPASKPAPKQERGSADPDERMMGRIKAAVRMWFDVYSEVYAAAMEVNDGIDDPELKLDAEDLRTITTAIKIELDRSK